MSAPVQAPADLFYFGPPDRRLFGALHESQTFAQREYGIVICYPFGNEYIRAHRACNQLALRLSQAGFPVLRFDYSGTGDSSGEAEDMAMADWRQDIETAIDVLRDRAGVESICLAGLRLGASLALEAVERPDVTALILWEPVVTGGRYLDELAEQHQELLWRFFDDAGRLADSMSGQYLGFPISSTLRGELERLNLLAAPPSRVDQTLIVESYGAPEIAQLRDRLRGAGLEVAFEQPQSFAVWQEDVDKGLVPDQVLRSIVEWAAEMLP